MQRAWGPPFVGTETAYFLSVNRSKRSVAVDIKSEAGKNIILDLARSCDVLVRWYVVQLCAHDGQQVENYLPGKLESLGLGYDAIAAVNSGLVYASISGACNYIVLHCRRLCFSSCLLPSQGSGPPVRTPIGPAMTWPQQQWVG